MWTNCGLSFVAAAVLIKLILHLVMLVDTMALFLSRWNCRSSEIMHCDFFLAKLFLKL